MTTPHNTQREELVNEFRKLLIRFLLDMEASHEAEMRNKINLIHSEYEEKRKKELEEIALSVNSHYQKMRQAMPSEKFPVAFFNCELPDHVAWKIYEMGTKDAWSIIKSKINPTT